MPEAVRNQVLGHHSSAVFRHYRNPTVRADIPGLFFRRPTLDGFLHTMTTLAIHVDPNAPVRPSAEAVQSLAAVSSPMRALMAERTSLHQKARGRRRGRRREPSANQGLKTIERRVRTLRSEFRRQALAAERTQYFQSRDNAAIEAQDRSRDRAAQPTAETADDSTLAFALPERLEVVRLFTREPVRIVSEEHRQMMVDTIRALAALCHRKSVVGGPLTAALKDAARDCGQSSRQLAVAGPFPDPSRDSDLSASRRCIFCIFDPTLAELDRCRSFASRQRQWDHVDAHLALCLVRRELCCPVPQCQKVEFAHVQPFKAHTERVHKYPLRPLESPSHDTC